MSSAPRLKPRVPKRLEPKPSLFTPTTDPQDLLRAPAAWLHHENFAVWSAGANFVGWSLWGHFGDDGAEQGRRLWIALSKRMRAPYDFVLDLRRLTSVSRGAFARILEFTKTKKPGLRRFALLTAEATPGGAIQIGLFVIRQPNYEWRSFTDWRRAAAWLARRDGTTVLEAAEQRTAELDRRDELLEGVRSVLAADLCASASQVAKKIGRSTRALQRSLHERGTTFRDERDRARVMRARELLTDPKAKLEAVASEVGCADRRSLNRLVRRLTGESPAEFRARAWGAPSPR